MGAKKERRVRKDDEVVIFSGEYGQGYKDDSDNVVYPIGKVMRLLRESNRVEVEIKGLDDEDKVIKHQRRSQEFPNGTKLYLNPTIHVSNVMKLSRWNERQNKGKSSAEDETKKSGAGKTKKSALKE
jgi:ribosomal protein L24